MLKLFSKDNFIWNRNFVLLLLGKMVSSIGSWVHYLAIVVFVSELTGSMGQTGVALGVSVVPTIILGPLAGTIVDNWNRKKIIVYTDLISGFFSLYLGIRAFSNIRLWEVYVVIVGLGICKTFFNPAINASIPNLVKSDQLSKANSMMKVTSSLVEVAGPLCGGILITLVGPPISFIVNGISFFISGISEFFINIPKVKRDSEKKKNVWADTIEGLKFIAKNRVISTVIFIFSILTFFVAPLVMVLKILSQNYYLMGDMGWSMLFAADALGVLCGTAYLMVKPIFRKEAVLAMAFPVFSGIALLVIGNVYNFYVALLVLFIQGFVSGLGEISIMTIFQRATPDDKRGKVFGFFSMFNIALVPLSMAIFGFLIDGLGVSLIMSIGGIALIIGGLVMKIRLTGTVAIPSKLES